jgi:predicted murein hydrolase (TIGR00659 family)
MAFGLALTLGCYALARWLHRRAPTPYLSPLVSTTMTIVALLLLTGIPVEHYRVGGDLLSLLLGPATVALGLPLYRHRRLLLSHAGTIALSVMVGAGVATVSVVVLASVAGLSATIVGSMAPKSVTAPVAIEVARAVGGDPALAAGCAVMTGTLGALFGPAVLVLLRVRHPVARGVAMGTVAHAQGTAAALMESELTGAVSAVALSLTAIAAALAGPPLIAAILAGLRAAGLA